MGPLLRLAGNQCRTLDTEQTSACPVRREAFQPIRQLPFNSGQRAIQLAAHLGAERVILLGYDCTLANGAHWHGRHPATMHNPVPHEVGRWHSDFSSLAGALPDVEIINASRETALTCFKRLPFEAALYAWKTVLRRDARHR